MATYQYYRMPGVAARITVTREGQAVVAVALHDMGMGTATAQTLVTAERLGLTMDQVQFEYGDPTMPGVVLAGGSQQTALIGAGVIAAHRALVSELLRLAGNASPLAGLLPEQVGSAAGGLCQLDDPARRGSYASILAHAGRDAVTAEAEARRRLRCSNGRCIATA